MKRELFAGAGWAAFGVTLWMWGARGAGAPVVIESRPREAAAARGASGALASGAPTTQDGGWRGSHGRVTLETLAAAGALRERDPGEDIATAIQRAASAAGRREWYRADWSLDGVLDGADVEAFAAAFNAGSPMADLNHDGRVDGLDFAEFLREFRDGERRACEAC